MARKEKIDNASKKRFERQETKRKQNVRSKRRFFLIVCEGAKTEPNYFLDLKNSLPPNVVSLVEMEVEGTGRNTLGVINQALAYKQNIEQQPGRVFDEVWAVFDRDSFPDQNFNNAIAKGNELECIVPGRMKRLNSGIYSIFKTLRMPCVELNTKS